MQSNSAKWHWGEGMKYALEGIKILFILNGASAVSVLTFIGNTKAYSAILVSSLIFYALGASTGVPTMICAYFTQLFYGNAEQLTVGSNDFKATLETAYKLHKITYLCIAVGILFFLIGVGLASWGLLSMG